MTITDYLPRPIVLGIGGTPKPGSLSERALRYTLRIAEAAGADTRIVTGPNLVLPMYEPLGERGPRAKRLIKLFRECQGLVLSTPSYHGTISGLLKNVLDYVEDMRNDDSVYLSHRCVGSLVCAGGPQAYGTTFLAVRSIIHALRAWPIPMGVGIDGRRKPSVFDHEGHCHDNLTANNVAILVDQVVNFVRMRQVLLNNTGHISMHSLFDSGDWCNRGNQ